MRPIRYFARDSRDRRRGRKIGKRDRKGVGSCGGDGSGIRTKGVPSSIFGSNGRTVSLCTRGEVRKSDRRARRKISMKENYDQVAIAWEANTTFPSNDGMAASLLGRYTVDRWTVERESVDLKMGWLLFL